MELKFNSLAQKQLLPRDYKLIAYRLQILVGVTSEHKTTSEWF